MCSFNNYINFHALHVLITSILIPLTFCAIVSHVLVLAIFPNWAVPKIIPILSDKQLKVIWKCSPLLVLSNKIKVLTLNVFAADEDGTKWPLADTFQMTIIDFMKLCVCLLPDILTCCHSGKSKQKLLSLALSRHFHKNRTTKLCLY